MGAEIRRRLLEQASEIVSKDRASAYGEPENNFAHIAGLWNAYIEGKVNHELEAEDIALMMALVKVARLSNNFSHWDSAVDIAGYAACLGDIAAVSEEKIPADMTGE